MPCSPVHVALLDSHGEEVDIQRPKQAEYQGKGISECEDFGQLRVVVKHSKAQRITSTRQELPEKVRFCESERSSPRETLPPAKTPILAPETHVTAMATFNATRWPLPLAHNATPSALFPSES